MLVLTRRLGEEIIIDDLIKLKVLKVKGNRVRLGVEAPPDLNIQRGELPQLRPDTGPLMGTDATTEAI